MVALSTSHWPGKKWKEKTEEDTDSSPNWKGSVLSFKKQKKKEVPENKRSTNQSMGSAQ